MPIPKSLKHSYYFLIFFLLASCNLYSSEYESSLKGYWRMEDTSGTVIDDTGTYNGTIYGTIIRGIQGKSAYHGNAFSFDGSGDYVDCGSTTNVWNQSSIEAWVYLKKYNQPPYKTIFQINEYYKEVWADVAFYMEDGHVNPFRSGTGTTKINLNEWTHVAMVNNGTTTLTYVNGKCDGIFATAPEWNDGWSFIKLGGGYPGDGESFNGNLDEIGLYNRALSSAEIYAHYVNGIKPNLNDSESRTEYESRIAPIFGSSLTAAGIDHSSFLSILIDAAIDDYLSGEGSYSRITGDVVHYEPLLKTDTSGNFYYDFSTSGFYAYLWDWNSITGGAYSSLAEWYAQADVGEIITSDGDAIIAGDEDWFMKSGGGAGTSSIPEPSSLTLILIAILAVLKKFQK